MKVRAINYCNLKLVCLFFFLTNWNIPVFSQSDSSTGIHPEMEYLKDRLILKIRPEYRKYCSASAIKIPELQNLWEDFEVRRTSKMFPMLGEPTRSSDMQFSGINNTFVDLSLIYEVEFPSNKSIPAFIQALKLKKAIIYAEPWYLYEPVYQPNDLFADTTGGRDLMWHIDQTALRQAWDVNRGDPSVIIGVTDSGTSFDHPDLQDQVWTNVNDPVDGVDNDGNGYTDDFQGYDLGGSIIGKPDNDANYTTSSHGVGVTGIIGATPDNNIGIPGLAFNCSYLPIKTSTDTLNGTVNSGGLISFGYQGIVYAALAGADVVNCSWGGFGRSNFGEDVVNFAALNYGVAVVAASGNSGKDEAFYPASFERAFSVANSFYGDTLYPTSTHHVTVDVAAPGGDIRTTWREDDYIPFFTGTSAASPVAAAAIGLVVSQFPELNGLQAAQRLRVTADDITAENPDKKDRMGTGRINVLRALTDPGMPSIRLFEYELEGESGSNFYRSGEEININGQFVNFLDPTQNLIVSLSAPGQEEIVEVLSGEVNFPVIGTLQGLEVSNAFQIRILEGAVPDQLISLRFAYEDPASGYKDFQYLELTVNKSYLDITANEISTSMNSIGNIGYHQLPSGREGLGFSIGENENALFEGGFLIGKSSTQVSDNIRNDEFGRDMDFRLLSQAESKEHPLANFFASSEFNDDDAEESIGVNVEQKAYAWLGEVDENYIIFEFDIENKGQQPINDLLSSIFTDWDISDADSNAAGVDIARQFMYADDLTGKDGFLYGVGLLSEGDFRARALTRQSDYSTASKFNALLNPPSSTSASITGPRDIMFYTGTGPFDIEANEKQSIAFSFMAAKDLESLERTSEIAKEKYRCVILGEGPNNNFSWASPTNLVADIPISFTDNNSSALSWNWDFGDGGISNEKDPVHIFQNPGKYEVKLSVSDEDCEVHWTQILEVSTGTPLNNSLESIITVYPNPSKGVFVLAIPTEIQSLELAVYAINGAIVKKQFWKKRNSSESPYVDLRNFSPGTYILKLSNNTFKQDVRLLIQH